MTDLEKALLTYLYEGWSKLYGLDHPLSSDTATFAARVRGFRQWLWPRVNSSRTLLGFMAEFERQEGYMRPDDAAPAEEGNT